METATITSPESAHLRGALDILEKLAEAKTTLWLPVSTEHARALLEALSGAGIELAEKVPE